MGLIYRLVNEYITEQINQLNLKKGQNIKLEKKEIVKKDLNMFKPNNHTVFNLMITLTINKKLNKSIEEEIGYKSFMLIKNNKKLSYTSKDKFFKIKDIILDIVKDKGECYICCNPYDKKNYCCWKCRNTTCLSCINNILKTNNMKCPYCRSALLKSKQINICFDGFEYRRIREKIDTTEGKKEIVYIEYANGKREIEYEK